MNAAYQRDGFLVVPDFLSAADCDALRARAAELVAGCDPGPARTIFSTRDQGHARDRYFLNRAATSASSSRRKRQTS